MKATGIVRPVDELGRVVIPKELRRTLGIYAKDPMEVFVDGDKVILRKFEPACMFCASTENTINYRGRLVCRDCISQASMKIGLHV